MTYEELINRRDEIMRLINSDVRVNLRVLRSEYITIVLEIYRMEGAAKDIATRMKAKNYHEIDPLGDLYVSLFKLNDHGHGKEK